MCRRAAKANEMQYVMDVKFPFHDNFRSLFLISRTKLWHIYKQLRNKGTRIHAFNRFIMALMTSHISKDKHKMLKRYMFTSA